VSDPIALARTARESLSKGLSALQGDPSLPAAVAELASPIAQAMGALHQIERSQGATVQPHADTALAHIRTALGQLQTQPPSHAALALAMEAVASSLAQVHALSKLGSAPVPAPPVMSPVQVASVPVAAKPSVPVHTAPLMNAPVQPAPKPVEYVQPAPKPAAIAPAAAPQANAVYAAPGFPQPAFPQPPRSGAPAAPAPVASAPVRAPAPAPVVAAPAPFGQADPFAATTNKSLGNDGNAGPAGYRSPGAVAPLIDAALGAHSVTNFYKGLAGNDIIEHGGLFVGTYMIPKLGSQVRLRVSLPGGYEFEAGAVVRWRRDPDNGDSQPGFGAQLTQISAEAKQLIYRYVRNREPLFHDDL
jgi:PilZ domain